jgi:xanthine dehydrogenase accessory factor
MTPQLLHALLAACAQRQPAVLATRLPAGEQILLPTPAAPTALATAAATAMQRRCSETVSVSGETWLLEVFAPPPRLLLIGAVHIAQALAPIATGIGFSVTVIDPRRAFATAERFPGVSLSPLWPDQALDTLAPDRQTAVATLSHDPKLDDPALDRALRSAAFYIGALGSRKTHAARLARLAERGHGAGALARIHGPIGLAIGAVTAAEIAVAIAAELVAAYRGAPLARRPVPE